MANWCSNELTIRGEETNLFYFKHIANTRKKNQSKDSVLSFRNFIEYPNNKWDYDWCIEGWGTSYNAQSAYLLHDKEYLLYKFETTWTPPIKIIKKMIEMYPELNFILNYESEDCDFQGVCEGYGGIILKEIHEIFKNKMWDNKTN